MDYFKDIIASRWIGYEGAQSAPYFRKEFDCAAPAGVRCAICAAGLYELYVNGKKVGDHEFDPVASIYTRHVRYVEYDLSKYLRKGKNTVGVVLGNGWYNCPIPKKDAWDFSAVPWRAYPRFRFEAVTKKDELLLVSDPSWKMYGDGPIVFNSFRAGETYDARKEVGDWTVCSFDDSAWIPAVLAQSPGGLLEKQIAAPVKVLDTIPMKGPSILNVYDAGVSIAGRVRIHVSGPAGAKVILEYAERLSDDGVIWQEHLADLAGSSRFQTDEYILKGGGSEVWESRFDYHGFRYVSVIPLGGAVIEKMEARVLGSSFDTVGSFECSDTMINKLQELTLRSYHSNFVGIPTDCPHREKNGWTGDAQLASETGLFNFDVGPSLAQWISSMLDCQRPNGALPAIVPTGGWGFNWGNGPAWDCAFFVIPWHVYLHTGDDSGLRANLEGMKSYINFVESMSLDHVVQFGLGDWCPPAAVQAADFRLTVTACYYDCLRIGAETAKLFGDKPFAKRCAELMKDVKAGYIRAFRKSKNKYDNGGMTALGTTLYFDLCEAGDRKPLLAALVSLVKKEKARAQFGIFGAKYVPRVLADNGYADLALEFFLQEEYPGWVNWVKRGATSLWETWEGVSSRNHIMFGDIGAWLYRFAAGFRHDPARPGYQFLTVAPVPMKKLPHVKASYRGYVSECTIRNGVYTVALTVPSGCAAELRMPDGSCFECKAGEITKSCPVTL